MCFVSQIYELLVLETKPDNAVTIIECDMKVRCVCVCIIGGEIVGQGGLSPPTLKTGGAEPPHIMALIIYNTRKNQPEMAFRMPQKRSQRV